MLGEPVLQEHDPRVLFVAGDFGRLMAETVSTHVGSTMISGTLRLLGRSHRMQRRTPRTKAGFVWQKLANALALLATAMLIAHGAAAGSLVPHSHAHISVHAESSPTATNVADPVPHHAPSMAVGEEPSDDNHDTLACCGDACLAALIPGRTADLKEPRRSDQKFVMPVSLLSGLAPDGPRRPPRDHHLI